MGMVFRWLFRLTGVVLGLALLALIGVYYLASRSLPDYDRTVEVAGLGAETRIIRDNANVPHIFATSDADVFFGLGFAHVDFIANTA